MNGKQLGILLVVLAVIGGGGLLIRKQQSSSWEGANPAIGKKLAGELPVNEVAHITFKQGDSEVNLVKKEELWRVRERNDYPANYQLISEFLLKVRDLKVTQSDKVGPTEQARLQLVPGQGTNTALVVDFKDQSDKTIKSLLMGKKHMRKSNRPSPMSMGGEDEGWPDGRYVKLASDSDKVSLISEAFANIETKPSAWLNKDFFKVERLRSIAVEFPTATNSWKLSRETDTGEWKLADAKPTEQLDAGKASGVGNPLNSPSFMDVSTTSKPEEAGLAKPALVTIDTFDNFSYTLKIGQKTNENYALAMTVAADLLKERAPGKDEKPEDKDKLDKEFKEKQKKLEEKLAQEKTFEKWIYLVESWTVEPLLKERAQLLTEKKEEPKKDEKPTAGLDLPKLDSVPVPAKVPEPTSPADSKPEPK